MNFVIRVTTERAQLEADLQQLAAQTSLRRQQLMVHILSDFEDSTPEQLSAHAFFAGINSLIELDSNYRAAFQSAGFAASFFEDWKAGRNCPPDSLLRPILHLALVSVLENLLIKETQDIIKSFVPDEAVAQLTAAEREALLLRPLTDMAGYGELTVRLQNTFRNQEIKLLGELVGYTEPELLLLPHLGRKSLTEAKDWLLRLQTGLQLGCLCAAEQKVVRSRQLLNSYMHIKVLSRAKELGKEVIDPLLCDQLLRLNITDLTQLATCPMSVIDTIIENDPHWSGQLVTLVTYGHGFPQQLTLGMEIPPHLNQGVKVWHEPDDGTVLN